MSPVLATQSIPSTPSSLPPTPQSRIRGKKYVLVSSFSDLTHSAIGTQLAIREWSQKKGKWSTSRITVSMEPNSYGDSLTLQDKEYYISLSYQETFGSNKTVFVYKLEEGRQAHHSQSDSQTARRVKGIFSCFTLCR